MNDTSATRWLAALWDVRPGERARTLLMGANLVDPLPLVVGWGALPIGIALGSLLSDKTAHSDEPRAKEAPPSSR